MVYPKSIQHAINRAIVRLDGIKQKQDNAENLELLKSAFVEVEKSILSLKEFMERK